MKDVYLLHLTNCGDSYFGLVDQEVWDWINGPLPEFGKEHCVKDAVPAGVDARLRQYATENGRDYKGVYVSDRRGAGDRAQAAMALSIEDGGDLDSVKEVMAYIKENEMRLVDEFEGLYM